MREVAQRSGVSATAIYHHFSGREDLVRHVLRIGFDRFRDYLSRGDDAAEPRQRLLAIATGYIDFALQYPTDYEVMFGPSHILPKNAYPAGLGPRSGKQTPFRRLVEVLEECRRSGAARFHDAEETALFLWSTLHGLVMLHRAKHIDVPPVKFREVSLRQAAAIVDQILPVDRPRRKHR